MKTIVFIALQLSQPRCIKRINVFKEADFSIKVYGFDSGLYNNVLNNLPFKIDKLIERNKNVCKIKKILYFVSNIRAILRENRKNAIFYFFGYEIASIAYFCGCRTFVYEEADVSAARIRNYLVRSILLWLDRLLVRKSMLTVFTSDGFKKYLFNREHLANVIVMPNKLSRYFDEQKRSIVKTQPMKSNSLKFGFVGLIRYPNTIIRFAKVVGKFFPNHEFHFYGDAEKAEYLDEELLSYKNIYIHGTFENPKDLSSIYEKIDLSVACYDTRSGNVRIAEPNKLYESIYFATPIVVSDGTFLAEKVKSLKIGDAIDASSDAKIENYIRNLTIQHLGEIIFRMKSHSWEKLVDDNSSLLESVRKLCE